MATEWRIGLRRAVRAARMRRKGSRAAIIFTITQLLQTLVEWEERHYADLLRIQEESERRYFDLNNFQPF
jgi:hypothetical protein